MTRSFAILCCVMSVNLLAGCTTCELAGRVPNTYLLCEDGRISDTKVVNIAEDQNFLPIPSRLWILLIDDAEMQRRPTARNMVGSAPEWRRLSSTGACVFNVAYVACRQYPPEKIRWILSVNPLVIGIGRNSDTPEELVLGAHLWGDQAVRIGAQMRLVRKNSTDLAEPVETLVVVAPWPGDVWTEAASVPGAKSLDLGPNATVRTAMDRLCQKEFASGSGCK